MVILGLFSPSDFYNGGLRKLAVNCVHNIYALDKQMALDMPNPPHVTANLEIPSYIAICKEWVQRGAGVEEALYTTEDESVCMELIQVETCSGRSLEQPDLFRTKDRRS
jgi:hypothetical protein